MRNFAFNMVTINDAELRQAAEKGMDEFIKVFVDAIHREIGCDLTAANMQLLTSDQLTLLGYIALRDEVMDGGFIQLIHNGWGGFIWRNPFAKAIRQWGLPDLSKLINHCRASYIAHHEAIERDMSDEEFMALYEYYPEFDDFDDAFVEREEDFTNAVAHYIDGHIDHFAKIEQ